MVRGLPSYNPSWRTHVVVQTVIELGQDFIGISYSVTSNNPQRPTETAESKTGCSKNPGVL